MDILSPMATGNGAHVIHNILANRISGYRVCGFNPYLTLCPPALSFLCRINNYLPDLIHTTPDYAYFLRQKSTPMVITFHNYVLDAFMSPYSSLVQRIHYRTDLKFFTQKALSIADTVTSVSKFTASIVKNELNYKGKIHVIYNGIDTTRFRPTNKPHNGRIKVLFSGNLTRRKGIDLLPMIADRLSKNVQIYYTSGLRTKHSLPSHPMLENIGNIPYDDMPKVYQEADILLFPSIREGFGLAVAEAMACGLPVVATDCSSLPELIINSQGGYLCQPKAIDEFANAINKLADSPVLRQEMGQFNIERVRTLFTIEKMVKSYEDLFDKTLHQSNSTF